MFEADAVSLYYLDLVAINPKREELRTEPVRVLLDTGAVSPPPRATRAVCVVRTRASERAAPLPFRWSADRRAIRGFS